MPLTAINYPRHFVYLAFGAIAVFFLRRLHAADAIFLASNGMLHAAAVVCALRTATWSRRMVFVAMAAAWSYAACYAGVVLVPPAVAQFSGFSLASAIGAAGYWCLVRFFWLRNLKAVSLLRTVSLCTAVTLVWDSAARHSLFLAIEPWVLAVHTLAWWLAFSCSLYLSERAAEKHGAWSR